MGLGSEFWDIVRELKHEDRTVAGLNALRGKVLAIDLSYWICQMDGIRMESRSECGGAAVHAKGSRYHTNLKPHLRNLFYRTVKLVSRVGAKPIFVADGVPPPLKLRARTERFCQLSGLPPPPRKGDQSERAGQRPLNSDKCARNSAFNAKVRDCLELLEAMGLPVIRAEGEAEALCAQLTRPGGGADFAVTADSDSFLHGATAVIKTLQVDYKNPVVETYYWPEVSRQLVLERNHLVALALLIGCDYALGGVWKIGRVAAMEIVRSCPGDQILNRLRAWGRGAEPTPAEIFGEAEVVEAEAEVCLERQKSVQKAKRRLDFCGPSKTTAEDESRSDCVSGVRGIKPPHCSVCRHVTGGESGKRIHFEGGCKQCGTTAGCHVARMRSRKRGRDDGDGEGKGEIACICGWCREEHAAKKRHEKMVFWRRVCGQMAATQGFPSEGVVRCYQLAEAEVPRGLLQWQPANMSRLESLLCHHLSFDPTRVWQHSLPLFSHHCLATMATAGGLKHDYFAAPPPHLMTSSPPDAWLLHGGFLPCAIDRMKVSNGEQLVVLRWQRLIGRGGAGETFDTFENMRPGGEDDVATEEEGMSRTGVAFCTEENVGMVTAACPLLWEKFAEMKLAKQSAKSAKGTNSRHKKVSEPFGTQSSLHSFFAARKPSRNASNSDKCTESGGPSDLHPSNGQGDSSPTKRMAVIIDLDSDSEVETWNERWIKEEGA